MPTQRKPALLLLLVMLGGLAFAAPGTSATSDDLALEVTITAPSTGGWYDLAHPLNITAQFTNSGDNVLSVPNDPSCDVVLMVYNSSGALVNNGSDECLDRSRAFDLFTGESRAFDTRTWPMVDEFGEWLPSGMYTIQLVHTGTNMMHEVEARAHTPVSLPDGLMMAAELHPTGEANEPHLLTMSMTNPTNAEIDIQQVPPCVLEVSLNGVLSEGPACFAEVPSLMPGEVLHLGHQVLWPSANIDISVAVQGNHAPLSLNLSGTNIVTPPQATLDLDMLRATTEPYATGEVMAPRLTLNSTIEADQLLRFTSSCKTALWVFDDTGLMLFDSTAGAVCSAIELEMGFETGGAESFSLPQWDFTTNDGCSVGSGRLLVVASMPELGMVTSQSIAREHSDPNPCVDHRQVAMSVDVERLTETDYRMDLRLSNSGDEATLRMVQACTLSLKFFDSQEQLHHEFPTLCNDYDGRSIIVPVNQTFNFEQVLFSTQEGEFTVLAPGDYTLEATLITSGRLVYSAPFTHTSSASEPITNEPTQAGSDAFVVAGQWVGLVTPDGTCWVLEEGEHMHLLSSALGLGWWAPSSAVQGMYEVVPSEPSQACAMYEATSVMVTRIVVEQPLALPADEASEVVIEEDVEASPSVVQPATVVSVIVTASLLSLFVTLVAGNESLRIPSTLAGLWFLGLLGKTHETTDGRYQRGRLMGYLTANPGCHFRALMSALDMSNGQISHHLRILENEEHVWRKKDGRLVRYYPLTSQLHPNTREADLPIPPLSPDPNSLQGKILTLLDHDGGLGEFPTQAELAKRLEKSQQLVSHHLRTLEKFGLVERRKMGIKQRYKLTREAVFLLETSDDFQ